MKQFDVVICGAGLAGSALAALLAKNTSLSIAVLEARPLSTEPVETQAGLAFYDPRVSALTAASQAVFEELGLWKNIQRKKAYSHMTVWDAEGTGEIEFDAAEIHQARLGFIVENRLLVTELLQ